MRKDKRVVIVHAEKRLGEGVLVHSVKISMWGEEIHSYSYEG